MRQGQGEHLMPRATASWRVAEDLLIFLLGLAFIALCLLVMYGGQQVICGAWALRRAIEDFWREFHYP